MAVPHIFRAKWFSGTELLSFFSLSNNLAFKTIGVVKAPFALLF
jgi:hypothetical protein